VVSLPFWLGIIVASIFTPPFSIAKPRFWLMIGFAVFPVMLFLLADYLFSDSIFMTKYFGENVLGHYSRGSSEGTISINFLTRIFRLYQPFLWILPVAIYIAIKQRKTVYVMPILTVLTYLLIYSGTHVIYNHYLVPFYALCAPLVALPIRTLIRPSTIVKILQWFSIAWIALSAVLIATGFQMHHLRSPELYALDSKMDQLLENKNTRDGILISKGGTNWEYIAKTYWRWRSGLVQFDNIEKASDEINSDREFAYILIPPGHQFDIDSAGQYHLILYDSAQDLKVLIPE
jgi:hypothetical protein